MVKKGEKKESVLLQSTISIPGMHNVENYMAAIAAVGDLGFTGNSSGSCSQFFGVEHRIELVRKFRGVQYYNDSIASSPTRTIAGLRSFQKKVILIAGGKDKDISYEALGPEIVNHVKFLVLTGGDVLGSTVAKICAAVLNVPEYDSHKLPILFIDDLKMPSAQRRLTQRRAILCCFLPPVLPLINLLILWNAVKNLKMIVSRLE